jgi:hypothetical protein
MNRQVLRLKETVLDKEHSSTLTNIRNTSRSAEPSSQYEQAEEMRRQALRPYETVLSE